MIELGSGEGCATADEADDAIEEGGITADGAMVDGDANGDEPTKGKGDTTDAGGTMT